MTQLVPSLTVAERCVIHRLRELPVTGLALKSVGDFVNPADIVCRGEIPGEIVVVNPADELGLPAEAIKDNFKVKVGDAVKQGDVLVTASYFFGLIKSHVLSPIDGTIVFITSEQGRIGVQMPPTKADRVAYCGGRVKEIHPGGGVELESEVSLVQGIFGIGGERVGVLNILPTALDRLAKIEDLPENCTGMILVGGMAPADTVLQEAARRGAVGFVCGSVGAAQLQAYAGKEIGVAVTGDEAVSMSLVMTEGFGEIPMSARVLEVLKARAGSVAAINGTTQVRAGAVRPEIIVPFDPQTHTSSKEEKFALPELLPGSRVRLIRFPFFGLFGTVTSLPDALQTIETGAAVRVLVVKLDDCRIVTVPRANIELLN